MSETKSNPSSVSSTPSSTPASAAANLNPAEFTPEFLRNQTSVRLNEIKKANKIRKKADQDLVDAIAEWFQKNHGPESATVSAATPKTRKPRAKKTTSDAGTTPNTVGVSTTLEDSIRAEVAQDAAGGELVSETTKTKAKKPRVKKAQRITQSDSGQPSTARIFKVPVNIVHKVNTGIITGSRKETSLTPVEKWIKETHDFLYGQENKVGDKAMNDIMCLIFLRLIQDKITDTEQPGKYDLLNLEKYINCEDTTVNASANRMLNDDKTGIDHKLNFTRFIKLDWHDTKKDESRVRIDGCLIKKFGRFLTVHPQTKSIFKVENFLHCQKSSTILGLLKRVDEFVKEHVEKLKHEDLIGEIYEYFINQYHKAGNKLGQFFTPRKMMMSILKFKEADIRANLATFTTTNPEIPINVWDPCMGTGGWLVSSINMFGTPHEGKQTFNICPAGNDVETDTLRMGIMNVMNVKPNMQLERFSEQNSLTNIVDNWIVGGVPIPNDMHFITTNPPFGASGKDDVADGETKSNGKKDKISSLEYEYKETRKRQSRVNMGPNLIAEYNTQDFSNVYTLNDKNMPIQFMEMCIHRLKEGGMCAIVLPYGELFFSGGYKTAREHFMSRVDITDVFLYPSGVFTHTGIKSCCVFFRKDSTGTKAIKFYKSNQDCNEFTEITTLTRADINQDPYRSWYLNDYLEDMYIRELMGKIDCEWVAFGNVFDLVKGTLQSSKVEEDPEGDGVLINWSIYDDYKKINNSTLSGENLFISTSMPNGKNGGYMVIKYHSGKCDYVDLLSKLVPINGYENRINLKYIYYYLNETKSHIEELYEKGACNKSLDLKNFLAKFKIPLPSAEIQERVVDYYDDCDKKIKFFTESIEFTNKFMQTTTEMNLMCYSQNSENFTTEKLGNISNIIYGDRIVNDGINGQYPVYGGGDITFYSDKFNREGPCIVVSRFGISEKCVRLINDKFYLHDNGFSISSKDTKVLINKYLYYYLLNMQQSIYKYYTRGTAQLTINMDRFKEMTVIIPNIEIQKRIIEENDLLENSIKNSEFMRSKHAELRKDKFHILLSKKYNQMVHGDPE